MTKHTEIEMYVPCSRDKGLILSSKCSKCDYHHSHSCTTEGAFVKCDYPADLAKNIRLIKNWLGE